MKKRFLPVILAIVLLAMVAVTAVGCVERIDDTERGYEADLAAAREEAEILRGQLAAAQGEAARLRDQLTAAQADADAFRTQIQDTEKSNADILTEMIRRVDYQNETVYVIGHKTPDSDTVCSAIGMAFLLNSIGISAEARIPGELNLESKFVFSELDYPVPEILEDAAGKQLWLVDHSLGTHMVNGADQARIVGVTDHHGIGDVETSETICVLSCPAGSTCAVVYQLCVACNIKLPQNVAGILLAGLLSDTANMVSSSVTKLDEAAFAGLKALSGINDTDTLFAGMLESKLSYRGLSDSELYYSDYKSYERNGVKYGIGNVKVASADLIPAMAARMQAVIESEIQGGCEEDFILYTVYDPAYSTGYIGIVGKDMDFVDAVVNASFGVKAEKQGDYYVCHPSLNRKTEIVPPIDAYLDTLSQTD